MQQGPMLTTYRKRRRARPMGWLAVLAAAALLGTVGFVYAKGRPVALAFLRTSESEATSAPAPGLTPGPTPAAAALPAVAAPSAASEDPAPAESTPADREEAATRQSESSTADPVAAAAVDFPGAPSVKPKSIASTRPKHKYVAITFDDGYGFDPKTLELLQKYDARCTTFVLGEWANRNKKSVRMMHEAGFEIANHTWDHKSLPDLTDEQIRRQLVRTQKVITSITGNQAPYMRPPGGATNSRVKQVAAELGYKVVMWNRTFADSSSKASPERAYRSVMERSGGVRPGDIIVCHWGSQSTYEALKSILPELQAQGYEFVTISELIADSKK